MIKSGNFAEGANTFSSDYQMLAQANGAGTAAVVSTPPGGWGMPNSSGRSGKGDQFLMVDGSTDVSKAFWRETVTLTQGQTYEFSYYVATNDTVPLQLQVNGKDMGAAVTATTTAIDGGWQKIVVYFIAEATGLATIALRSLNPKGGVNDFAIDDLSLEAVAATTALGNFLKSGDFNNGVSAFSTDYKMLEKAGGAGTAAVVKTNTGWDDMPVKTGRGGVNDAFLMVDGSTDASKAFWREVVTLTQGQTYEFSYHVATNQRAPLQLQVNGKDKGTAVTATKTAIDGGWEKIVVHFVAESTGPATVALRSLSNAGAWNDFGIDDISLKAVEPAPENLLQNGSFYNGVSAFSSDYQMLTQANGAGTAAVVSTPPDKWGMPNSSGRSGKGDQFLMVDGSTDVSKAFWRETVTLTQGQTYEFSFYVATNDTIPLQLQVNGKDMGAASIAAKTSANGGWQQVVITFTAESTGPTHVALRSLSDAGAWNDFGIDDLSLKAVAARTALGNLLKSTNFINAAGAFSTDYKMLEKAGGAGTAAVVKTNTGWDDMPVKTGRGGVNDAFLMVDGSTDASKAFWREVVTLTQGQTYEFSYYVATNQRAPLQLQVNGKDMGTAVTATKSAIDGGWEKIVVHFVAESTGPATVALRSLSNAGAWNDFGIDDISLKAVEPAPENLLQNGSFYNGMNAFSSDYQMLTQANGAGTAAVVSTPPDKWGMPNSSGRSGKGDQFLMVDGSTDVSKAFWRETVTLTQGQTYEFSFYVATKDTVPLQLQVNGKDMGAAVTATTTAIDGGWGKIVVHFIAETTGPATIALRSLNPKGSGNDFAVDDLCLKASSQNFTIDTEVPTATIMLAATAIEAGETSLVTITFSEKVIGFTNADLIVENGTLSSVKSIDDGMTWIATFTPAANIEDTTNVISLKAGSYTDAAANSGTSANSGNYQVKTPDPLYSAESGYYAWPTASYAENGTGAVYSASTDGEAGVTYHLEGGNVDMFDINPLTGVVEFKASPDYEKPMDDWASNVYGLVVTATDTAGNFTEQVVFIRVTDINEAPTALALQDSVSHFVENLNTASRVKVADLVVTDDALGTETLTLSGADAASFEVVGTELYLKAGTQLNYESKTNYSVTVTAKDAALAGSSALSTEYTLTVTNVAEAGDAVIELGARGQLIAPVHVEGEWFYYWDRNKDGLATRADQLTHEKLDGIFNQDVNGVVNPAGAAADTTETYRYATLNGVKVALPTLGSGFIEGQIWSGNAYKPGTAVNSGKYENPVYDDMTAIWDAYNGSTTGTNLAATLQGWAGGSSAYYYWSASSTGVDVSGVGRHGTLGIGNGSAQSSIDTSMQYVALQVL